MLSKEASRKSRKLLPFVKKQKSIPYIFCEGTVKVLNVGTDGSNQTLL